MPPDILAERLHSQLLFWIYDGTEGVVLLEALVDAIHNAKDESEVRSALELAKKRLHVLLKGTVPFECVTNTVGLIFDRDR